MTDRTADPLTTKEGIRVKIGQLWRDLDKRMDGRKRRVVEIDAINAKARMVEPRTGAFPSWVSIRRMHKHSTGWELLHG